MVSDLKVGLKLGTWGDRLDSQLKECVQRGFGQGFSSFVLETDFEKSVTLHISLLLFISSAHPHGLPALRAHFSGPLYGAFGSDDRLHRT